MIDGDKLALSSGLSLEDEPEVCIGWYRNQIARYAPKFSDVTFHAHLPSSTGLALLRNGSERRLFMRLWLVLDQPYLDYEVKAWLHGMNDRWRADICADGKQALVDTALANAAQLHFSPPIQFSEIAWIRFHNGRGASDELALNIPTATEATGKSVSPSGSFRSRSAQGRIDQIGHDKSGFHEPIRQAIWEAVREHGDDLDTEDLRSRITEAALTADRGARSRLCAE